MSSIFICAIVTGNFKYSGTVLGSNGLVVFAPSNQAGVGLFDPTTRIFSTFDISSSVTGNFKYAGASATANLVVFAPYINAPSVGVCNVVSHTAAVANEYYCTYAVFTQKPTRTSHIFGTTCSDSTATPGPAFADTVQTRGEILQSLPSDHVSVPSTCSTPPRARRLR
eukprot:5471397-Prymnesium_polylepis.4